MKIGEIWTHRRKEKLLSSDFNEYEDGDEHVEITDIDNDGERISFSHLKTGISGILWRNLFIRSYRRNYNENR